MKLIRVLVLFLAGTAVLLPLAASRPAPEEMVLVRIGLTSLGLLPPQLRTGLTAVAKLRYDWLAVWPAETAGRVARAGADLEILDSRPEGKAYFLVRTQGRGDGAVLEQLGRVVRLDAATVLFWSVDREAREILPTGWDIARLFLETAIPLSAENEPEAVIPALPMRSRIPPSSHGSPKSRRTGWRQPSATWRDSRHDTSRPRVARPRGRTSSSLSDASGSKWNTSLSPSEASRPTISSRLCAAAPSRTVRSSSVPTMIRQATSAGRWRRERTTTAAGRPPSWRSPASWPGRIST